MWVVPGAVEGELASPVSDGDARAGQVDRYPALVARCRCEVCQSVSFFITLDVRVTRNPLEGDGPAPGRSGVQEGPDSLCQGRVLRGRAPAEQLEATQ